jgi:hypothetical protein
MPSRKDEVPSLFELPQDEPDALKRSDADGDYGLNVFTNMSFMFLKQVFNFFRHRV